MPSLPLTRISPVQRLFRAQPDCGRTLLLPQPNAPVPRRPALELLALDVIEALAHRFQSCLATSQAVEEKVMRHLIVIRVLLCSDASARIALPRQSTGEAVRLFASVVQLVFASRERPGHAVVVRQPLLPERLQSLSPVARPSDFG